MGVYLNICDDVAQKPKVFHRIMIPYCINKGLYKYGCSASDLDQKSGVEVAEIMREVLENLSNQAMEQPPDTTKCCMCFQESTPNALHVRYWMDQAIRRLHKLATKYKDVRWRLGEPR